MDDFHIENYARFWPVDPCKISIREFLCGIGFLPSQYHGESGMRQQRGSIAKMYIATAPW
jgi:hypothetical protein